MPIIGDVDPEDGNRYREVKAMVREALRTIPKHTTEREQYDSVGLQLTERFRSYLEVLNALAALPWSQRRAIELTLGEDMTHAEAAQRMGVSERCLRDYIRTGIEAMIPLIYG